MKIFQPNIHSQYKIDFSPISEEKRIDLNKVISFFAEGEADIKTISEFEVNSKNYKVNVLRDNKVFLLRENIANDNKEKVSREIECLLYLNRLGSLVPTPIPNRANGSYFMESEGVFYTAYEFIEGNHYSGEIEGFESVCRSVVGMHGFLKEMPASAKYKKCDDFFVSYDCDFASNLCKYLHSGEEDSAIFKLLEKNQSIIYKAIETFKLHKDKLFNDSQIVHRDLHPHNTLINEKKGCYLLDFSEINHGSVFEDLAFMLYRMIRQRIVYLRQKGDSRSNETIIGDCLELFFSIKGEKIPPANIYAMLLGISLKKIFTISREHFDNNNCRFDGDMEKHLISLLEVEYFKSSSL